MFLTGAGDYFWCLHTVDILVLFLLQFWNQLLKSSEKSGIPRHLQKKYTLFEIIKIAFQRHACINSQITEDTPVNGCMKTSKTSFR